MIYIKLTILLEYLDLFQKFFHAKKFCMIFAYKFFYNANKINYSIKTALLLDQMPVLAAKYFVV